ncbi:MAG: protein phosphatase 2C domain-containing protein [Actinomycetota bacterium]|nr:protein phosphatase 2C domain-containing protein [Actinomycetota bacterium]
MSLALRYSATSDVGRVRKNNQDSGFASEHLLVVADGMGGAAAGDIASAETVQIMRRLHDAHPDDMLGALAGAVQRANDRLGEIVEDDPSVEGMGTTVTAIMFDGDTMGLAHIGDSRAYLLRDGKLTQLTADHTFVQGLVDEGRITEVEARSHPHRSLLLRALDGRHDAEPDLTTFEARPGDRLLVCSDGLCGYVDDHAIEQQLESGTPDAAALGLLQLALDAGGPDNITCVVGDVVDSTTPVDPDSAAAATGPMLVGAAAEQSRGRMGGDTATQPAVADTGPHGAGAADPEELRYAPRAPRRFRWLRRLAVLAVVLALLVLAGRFAYGWTQEQYYVADSGDTVAIYQGIEAEVPLVSLSSLHEQSDIHLSTLPGYWRTRVLDGIDATDLTNAHNIVRQLRGTARACAEAQATPSPSPTPTSQRGGSGEEQRRAGERQRGSAQASGPTAQPTPTPSPSPTGDTGGSGEPTSQPTTEPGCVGATP